MFRGGGGHGGGGFAVRSFGGGGGHGHGGGYAPRAFAGGGGHGHGAAVKRQQVHGGGERQQARAVQRQQARGFERQQARQQARGFERQQARGFERQQLRGNVVPGQQQVLAERFNGRGNLNVKGGKAASQQVVLDSRRFAAFDNGNPVQIRPLSQVEQFVGVPVATVAGIAALSPLPTTIQYLYPDTPDYYFRYGDGYLYQVDRTDNLIAALIPLLAGGYLPGQYLPNYYMSSYVPSYYGFNSFYQDYGDDCYRYGQGVVYEVDCYTGFVEDVIPLYAGGYGVGQLLPSAYSYYNVPYQYRSVYYDTPDYNYWYAPGAIYQVDPRSSMITSVAALLSPGFTIGQPLPAGYGVYNVPYDYRATYYDTPTAWYRYNNGYIYQVDPTTQLVTAIVASLLGRA
jgi:hypothetical protein